jgi:hypothetical protein
MVAGTLLLPLALGCGKRSDKKNVAQTASVPRTFCNPLNISYRFQLDEPSRREAADPAIVVFRGDYYLFASKSGGYWWSSDMVDWKFVPITADVLPIEDYAPGPAAFGDTLYYTASSGSKSPIYMSTDPKAGVWKLANPSIVVWDPCLFRDPAGSGDYLFWGCSPRDPIYGIKVNMADTADIKAGSRVSLFNNNPRDHGWERRGDNNDSDENLYMEGPWMTEHEGTYYLQYAAPGTEFKTYADGIYTSKSPLGPFEYATYSPFSYKPTGFIAGAGHGGTFQDKNGNWWRVVTMIISVKHMFERRIGIIPAGFDADGVMYANTLFGDYPIYLPERKRDQLTQTRPAWMQLARGAAVEVSSTKEPFTASLASDEDAKTYWSAATGNDSEWLMLDLGEVCSVNAVQVNFGEEGTKLFGRTEPVYLQYVLETSMNKSVWVSIANKRTSTSDTPHDYIALDGSVQARYLRIRNVFTPGGGTFAIRDLRVFGTAPGNAPGLVQSFTAERDPADDRNAHLHWEPVSGADGYVIRFGTAQDKLYNNYQVYSNTTYDVRSLNRGVDYYFVVDTFNRSGYTPGHGVHKVPANPVTK